MKTNIVSLIVLTVALRLVASPEADGEFVAHEWGTFTSVQGADGVQIEWNPLIKTDLPGFVYARSPQGLLLLKSALPSFVRMETPVIYFYSKTARTADVRVDFPQGRITEWYPQANTVAPYETKNPLEKERARRSFIEWKGVNILPRETGEISMEKLIREEKDVANHYYAARETDANFLRMEAPQARRGAEYENLLFYRGIGTFQAPLTISLHGDENTLQLSTGTAEPLTDLFVLTIRNGQAKYQSVERVDANVPRMVKLNGKRFAPLTSVRTELMQAMTQALVKQGLYDREAIAMVNTWKDQWFSEEGVRVLYLLPREWTDSALPLAITPPPTKTVRVMVGRAEIITPAMEWELLKQVVRYSEGDAAAKELALMEVKRLGLGRFTEPAVRRVLGRNPNKHFAATAWALAKTASEAGVETPAIADHEKQPGIPAAAETKKAAAMTGDRAVRESFAF